jgi:hypothetical protein
MKKKRKGSPRASYDKVRPRSSSNLHFVSPSLETSALCIFFSFFFSPGHFQTLIGMQSLILTWREEEGKKYAEGTRLKRWRDEATLLGRV